MSRFNTIADSKAPQPGAHVLVTGGAGYIGSHVVRQLADAGHQVVVLDNLSTGFRQSVLHGDLIVGDVADQALVSQILDLYNVDTVMHFAAKTIVPESVADPMLYYTNNTQATGNLVTACLEHGVENFIFSSTAAVYGTPESGRADEDTPTNPINPYGRSKLMSEWMLRDAAAAGNMNYVALRYFNVSGNDPEMRIGQRTKEATLLIKVAAEVATGKRDHLTIFGDDYETRDGTGVRDYVHVEDLADAHLLALKYLKDGGESTIVNCGYGEGASVDEVVSAFGRAAGRELPVVRKGRRAGDPAQLVATADKIRRLFNWQPRYNDLDFIVRTALAWEHKLDAERATPELVPAAERQHQADERSAAA